MSEVELVLDREGASVDASCHVQDGRLYDLILIEQALRQVAAEHVETSLLLS